MLLLPTSFWHQIVAHCLDGLPLEACGLLAGRPPAIEHQGPGVASEHQGHDVAAGHEGKDMASELVSRAVLVEDLYPTTNGAASARVYTIPPAELLRADRAAEGSGLSLIGVWHSHTHTPPYPSPTDIAQAPDPSWHYVIVSLSAPEPALRSYLVLGGTVHEEAVELV